MLTSKCYLKKIGLIAAVAAGLIFFLTPAHSAPSETTGSESGNPAQITMAQAIILGIVEGLTEYLPVSSTGHLILAADAMHLGGFAHNENGDVIHGPLGPIMEPNPALNAFNIIIQIGAILAVMGLYFGHIREMSLGLVGKNKNGQKLLINLIVAFIPAAIFGLIFKDLIEQYLFSSLTVAIALAGGGVAMILATRLYKNKQDHISSIHELTPRAALMIGLVQCLAMWPGTSRSMVTILAGMGIGFSMVTAAEFSFLLALPTLGAATLYKMVTQWEALTTAVGLDVLIAGIIMSTVVAAFSVKFLITHLTKYGLAPFGFYRIALAVGIIYYFTVQA